MSREIEGKDKGLSRRQLLVGAGVIAASTAALSFSGLVSSAEAKAEAKGGSSKKWPWPYVNLDPATTAEIAYQEWYRVFCGAAVINSVFSQLSEKVGEPYKSFPADGFVFLEGGMVGWGTICGSNAGANIVCNLITGPRIAGPDCGGGHSISSDVMHWYSSTPLPAFTPKKPKQPTPIAKTTSDSPLCHNSLGIWMAETGFPVGSPERKDRCARVAASVAYKLVEDLNAWNDGLYEPNFHWDAAGTLGIPGQPNCTSCHGKDVPTPPKGKKA